MKKTYDIWFSKGLNSKRLDKKMTYGEAYNFIDTYIGSNNKDFIDFRNGIVSIKCNETGITALSRSIVRYNRVKP